MEGLVLKILGHLDLNKDGKPDLEQVHALVDKYGPYVSKVLPPLTGFLKAGGYVALKTLLMPLLNDEAKKELAVLEAVTSEVIAK